MSRFKKAEKKQSFLRLALFGLSGGGKTFTSLSIATGISNYLSNDEKEERIAVIDSERGTASKYSDRFDFDALNLESFTVKDYVMAINEAKEEGYKILVIDSISHAWQELLQEVDKIANAKYKGNTWAAWNEGTPKQKALINSIVQFPGHLIVTMRAKMEYENLKDSNNRTQIKRLGLSPEQGKGIEYEFDLLASIDDRHVLDIQKDRTGKFQDEIIEKPGIDFGVNLIKWLQEGVSHEPVLGRIKEMIKKNPSISEAKKALKKLKDKYPFAPDLDLSISEIENYIDKFNDMQNESMGTAVDVKTTLTDEQKQKLYPIYKELLFKQILGEPPIKKIWTDAYKLMPHGPEYIKNNKLDAPKFINEILSEVNRKLEWKNEKYIIIEI